LTALAGPAQADDAAQQHRLAAAGAADHGEDFAAVQVQVEVLVHLWLPKRLHMPRTSITASALTSPSP
jgi:hypothetical protein